MLGAETADCGQPGMAMRRTVRRRAEEGGKPDGAGKTHLNADELECCSTPNGRSGQMNPAELAVNATRLHACFDYIPEQWSLVKHSRATRPHVPAGSGRAGQRDRRSQVRQSGTSALQLTLHTY